MTQPELLAIFQAEPYTVEFFQAVHALEQIFPERDPVGGYGDPAREAVRFVTQPAMSFPASEVHAFWPPSGQKPARLVVNMFGLASAFGPLPNAYTTLILERARSRDHALRDFLDVFNHRMISLFYRGWQKYRFYIAYERTGANDDVISRRLLDLVGLGTESLMHRMEIADEACLYYDGLLSERRPTAQGLKQLLQDYFQVPVKIEQFTGTWRRLPPENRSVLTDSGAFCERLGMGTIVGDEVFDQHGAVTVRLGPMCFERYREFLPGARASLELRSWLRLYANREFDFVIRLMLDREEVPQMKLGSEGAEAPCLGLVSWIKNRALDRDPDEATYRLN